MVLTEQSPKKIIYWDTIIVSDMQWPCPDGFHVPLSRERQAVYDVWTALWGWSADWTNFGIALKLPFAGYRYRWDSGVGGQGSYGGYWSSTRRDEDYARNLYFISSNINPQNYNSRSQAISVRSFKDTPVTPTSSWTKLYWTSIEAGWIFWSNTDWLISLSSDWQTWITISDKNLWATTVYNDWDTLSEANCGWYFQRWNNHMFPFTWSVTTSSTKVDASTYWPWNYYDSSTFITVSSSPYRWDTTDNWNLRWWVTQWTSEKATEIKAVYLWETKVRPPKNYRVFTISWEEKSDMSSWWTYLDDAAWLTAGDGAFDDFFWYSAVLLNTSGVETAEMKQSWWVFTGAMTTLGNITSWDNVMIKFPVRWIKMTKSWSTVTLSITEELDKDGYQYYAFQQWQTNNITATKDKFYMWTYMWTTDNNKLKSWSWQQPIRGYTEANYITYAGNNGTWYTIEWFYQRMYIAALYMMKYWNPNHRTTIWYWYSYSSSYAQTATTWWTDSQTNATYGNTSQTNIQAKLFWLEDRWGSRWEFIWWAYLWTSKVLYTQLSGYSWTTSWWVTTNATINGANSYISTIAWTNKAMFAPIATVSSRSYYTDETVANAADRLIYTWDYYRGLFWLYPMQTTDTNNNAWARLMYL